MTRRWIVAVALGIVGGIMLTAPDRLYSSGTYAVAHAIAPRWMWATAFLGVAAVAAWHKVPRWAAAALLAGHITAWAGALFAAVVTGEAGSGQAWVPWMLVAALVVHHTAVTDP